MKMYLLTFPVSHTVKKQPVGGEGPVPDEAHVMAGLDACHSKERHSLAGGVRRAGPWPPRNTNLKGAV